MEMSLASTAELRSVGMELSDPIPKFWNFFKKRMSDKFSQAILEQKLFGTEAMLRDKSKRKLASPRPPN